MKLLYVTDLHGHHAKYRQIFRIARDLGVDIVVNGGDILPKSGGDLHTVQAKFFDFLDPHLGEYQEARIRYAAMLGNDDLRIYNEQFDKMCSHYPLVTNLAQSRLEVDEFDLIGMNWVVDYPFRLKDRCRRDTENYRPDWQLGTGLLSQPDGFEDVPDWPAQMRAWPTIEEELNCLPLPRNPETAIYVIHMPPAGLRLDMCGSGDTVGSEAIHQFIKHHQPLMTLHGHIHESPDVSGTWRTELGQTWCVQPGQMKRLSYVLIELPEMKMERYQDDLVNS